MRPQLLELRPGCLVRLAGAIEDCVKLIKQVRIVLKYTVAGNGEGLWTDVGVLLPAAIVGFVDHKNLAEAHFPNSADRGASAGCPDQDVATLGHDASYLLEDC